MAAHEHAVVHQAPPKHGTITGCCGLTPDQLQPPYQLVDDPTLVTCRGTQP